MEGSEQKRNVTLLVFLNENSGFCAEHRGKRARVNTGRLTR